MNAILSALQIKKITDTMRDCGKMIRNAHDIEKENETTIKVKPGSANFVTVYDVSVQNKLIADLHAIVPSAHFFAEEKENAVADTKNGLCFVIDPIDGTTNFIHDYKASSISVGLLSDGVPVFGAVYNPYNDEMFSAVTGGGAFCNGKQIHCSVRPFDKAIVCFGSSPYYKDEIAQKTFSLAQELFLKTSDIRRSGSAAIDLCQVACGRAEIFFESRLSPWDYMASYVIIAEAGGFMTNYAGTPVCFDASDSVVAFCPSCREKTLEITLKYL